MSAPPLAAARSVSRRFAASGAVALDGVSIEVRAGERVLLTGPSGSGKSTLVHVLGALEAVDAGEVWLGASRIDAWPDSARAALRGREVSVVFQGHLLPGGLTALETVATPLLWARGASPRDAERTARAQLAAVGLEAQAAQRVETLSGGQRQRVAVARALATQPRLVLADEPTAQLDPETARAVLALLCEWQSAAADRALLVVSHDAEARGAEWTRRLAMEKGRLVA